MMRWGVGFAVLLGLAAVVGWPAVATVLEAMHDAGEPVLGGGIVSPRPARLALETLKLVGLTELIALPLGVVAGLIVFRTDAWGRRALLMLLAVALFVPMPLHALGWIGSFGNAGRSQALGSGASLAGLPGAAFIHAMAALPWVAIVAGLGMRSVERSLEEAALMDMPAWRVMLGVTLRRSLGAIAGAALAVAVLTAGDMTITDLLQVRTYAEETYIRAQLGMGQGAAAAVVAGPLFLTLGVLIALASRAILAAEPARLPTADVAATPFRLGRWHVPVGLAAWIVAGGLVGLPLYGLVWRAGRIGRVGAGLRWSPITLVESLGAAWTDLTTATVPGSFWSWASMNSRPLAGSLLWATVGAVGAVALAWPLAWLARGSRAWRWVAAGAAALALSAPGPVAGVALKLAYLDLAALDPGPEPDARGLEDAKSAPPGTLAVPASPSWLRPLLRSVSRIGAKIHDSAAILVLAYVLRTFPYALLILWPAVRGIAPEHLEAATVDGLSPWAQAWRIGLPMTRASIVAAGVASLVLALGELPAAYFVAPPGHDPLARVIWGMLHTGVESHLSAIGLILIGGVVAVGSLAALAIGRAYRV